MSIWDTVNSGFELGTKTGRRLRDRRAFREGGLTAVEQAAGGAGDLETMEGVRGMQRREREFTDERTAAAYQRMEQIAPWARNVVRATRNMDPGRARVFLEQNRQRFLDFGFTDEQIRAGIEGLSSADPAQRQEWQTQIESAFTQHQDPSWSLVGDQAIGLDNQGHIFVGDQLPEGVNPAGRYATPEEVTQAGYRQGTVVWIAPNEPPRVIQQPTMYRPRSGDGLSYPDDGYDYEGE